MTKFDPRHAFASNVLTSRSSMPKDSVEVFDTVVLGGGAAGLTAATVAACEGMRVLLLEKASVLGGTSAISGGACWVPQSHHAAEVNAKDSRESVLEYVRQFTGERLDSGLFESFLELGPKAVEYLEKRTAVRFIARPLSPDYRPELPGATLTGRVLEPREFDGRALGSSLSLLRRPMPEFTAFGGMMVTRADAAALLGAFSSIANFRRCCELLARYVADRLRYGRGTRLLLGNALVAALLKSALDNGVHIRVGAVTKRLVMNSVGGVEGVEYEWNGALRYVSARAGVVLATGGYSGSPEELSVATAQRSRALSSSDGAGGGASLAKAVGAELPTNSLNDFFFSPVSTVTRTDGTKAVYPHIVLDRQKPGIIAVNQQGVRFTNEADSYHDFGESQLRAHGKTGAAIPAFLICDRQALKKYGMGAVHPGGLGWRHYVQTGYLIEAPTVAELAGKIGVDPKALTATVARANGFASMGLDTEFGRGSNAYHRFLGDADHRPNPCLGTIETPPFYAIQIKPGVLGSARGLAVNGRGEVLHSSGRPIDGLYACGNDMHSLFLGTYPGPGITLGPAVVFGYAAAKGVCHRLENLAQQRSPQKATVD